MSSSTAAAGTTISQPTTPRSTPRTTPPPAVTHDGRRSADLGRPRGRRSWSDFAEAETPQPAPR